MLSHTGVFPFFVMKLQFAGVVLPVSKPGFAIRLVSAGVVVVVVVVVDAGANAGVAVEVAVDVI